jgi:hypothetical protein
MLIQQIRTIQTEAEIMRGSFLFSALIAVIIFAGVVSTQTTGFTYQGSLKDGVNVANGNYDFEFLLFDALSGGTQVGSTLPRGPVAVSGGIFSVSLDFGSQFPGASRFLEMHVKPTGGGSFNTLSPRQQIDSAPYSIKSLNTDSAATATNATQLGGLAASQYVVTTDPRMTDARSPTAGSANYVQNTTSPQASSNFNISGTGTANIFSATTQFNIGANRILTNAGSANLFAGVGAGAANTGGSNAFFGNQAGAVNTNGDFNAFFGAGAGDSNTTGDFNAFFGRGAGQANTGAAFNAFFGMGAGEGSVGDSNTFVGALSGNANTIGSLNTLLGWDTNVTANNLSNATAIGARAAVAASNSLVLGSINGVNNATSDTNVGIGTTTPTQRLHVVGDGLFTGTGTANIFSATTQYNIGANRILSNAGTSNLFAGVGAGQNNTGSNNTAFGANAGNASSASGSNAFFGTNAGMSNTTTSNSFFGAFAGANTTMGSGNTFVGINAGVANTDGNANTFLGRFAGNTNTLGDQNTLIGFDADVLSNNLTNAIAIGSFAAVGASNSMVLGGISGVNGSFVNTNVGIGTTAPSARLQIVGTSNSITEPVAIVQSSGSQAPLSFRVGANEAIIRSDNGGNLVFATILGTAKDMYFRAGDDASTTDLFIESTNGNVGIGTDIPSARLHLTAAGGNIVMGDPGCSAGFTGIGFGAMLSGCSNYSMVGNGTDTIISRPAGGVIDFRMGNISQASINSSGVFSIGTLGAAGATALCRNASNQISTCSSSLRYKTNIGSFSSGLKFVKKLKPISFDWKDGGMKDVGFGAEDIAKIDSRFVTYNSNGEVEGVKYDRVSVVLVNAVKEQQEQIESQDKKIEAQQNEINELRQIVCELKPDAKGCGSK